MNGHDTSLATRRALLGAAAAGFALAPWRSVEAAADTGSAPTANEDLMQEHGLVGRVILVYRRAGQLLTKGVQFDPALIGRAAGMVAGVIHGHHEVEEEEIVFPAVAKTREMNMLVEVLRSQHRAARALTATIGNNATPERVNDSDRRQLLLKAMDEFSRMYEPHGVFEDTIVYPAFRNALSTAEYRKVSRRFLDHERKLHGVEGFGRYARELAAIEDALGVSLADYTEQLRPVQAGRAPK